MALNGSASGSAPAAARPAYVVALRTHPKQRCQIVVAGLSARDCGGSRAARPLKHPEIRALLTRM